MLNRHQLCIFLHFSFSFSSSSPTPHSTSLPLLLSSSPPVPLSSYPIYYNPVFRFFEGDQYNSARCVNGRCYLGPQNAVYFPPLLPSPSLSPVPVPLLSFYTCALPFYVIAVFIDIIIGLLLHRRQPLHSVIGMSQ